MQTVKQNSAPLLLFTGGGTGGHVYPNLALAEEFCKRGMRIGYVGAEGDCIERRLCKQYDIPYFELPTVKLIRSLSPSAIKNNLSIPFVLKKSVAKARALIDNLHPSIIFSKGGFVAVPLTLASLEKHLPTFVHESDLTLGLANKLAAKRGATVLKANPHSKFDGYMVGMPLRPQLFGATPPANLAHTKKPILLIMGGSLGAQAINQATKLNLDKLKKQYFVVHLCGKGKNNLPKQEDYLPLEYCDDIPSLYAAASVVVARAGATTVFELAALRKRALFIPLPKGNSRGDQIDNARLASEYGASVLWQVKHFFDKFLQCIQDCAKNPPMTPILQHANGKIADIVCASLRRGEKCIDKKPLPNGLQSSC